MNGDDERDYAEEAAVQRDTEVEGLAELAAERSAYDPMTGPECYRKACRLVAYAENQIPDDEPAQAAIVARAQVYATLALAAATAANIRRNGALADVGTRLDEAHKSEKLAEEWLGVLG